jgi:hypothetical protein
MALTALESNTVSRGIQAAILVVRQLQPLLAELNIIYDASGGAKSTITQDNLNLVPSFSGLTKQQLDDAMFALTGTLRGDILNAFAQLAQLAARG